MTYGTWHLLMLLPYLSFFIYFFYFLNFLARPRGMWDLSSPTRDWTHQCPPFEAEPGSVGKESMGNAGDTGHMGLIPRSGRSSGGGEWQPTPVFLPEESHGQRSLGGYSPRGPKELDMTEELSTHACSNHWTIREVPECLPFFLSVSDCKEVTDSRKASFQVLG